MKNAKFANDKRKFWSEEKIAYVETISDKTQVFKLWGGNKKTLPKLKTLKGAHRPGIPCVVCADSGWAGALFGPRPFGGVLQGEGGSCQHRPRTSTPPQSTFIGVLYTLAWEGLPHPRGPRGTGAPRDRTKKIQNCNGAANDAEKVNFPTPNLS